MKDTNQKGKDKNAVNPIKPKKVYFATSDVLDEISVMDFEFRKVVITKDSNVQKRLAFYHHDGKIDYTEDYKILNPKLNIHNKRSLYEKLNNLRSRIGMDYYIYFNYYKDGSLIVYDMCVNDTFLDYEDVHKLCDVEYIECEYVQYVGEYDEYIGPLENILIRYDLELPEEKRLFKSIKEVHNK